MHRTIYLGTSFTTAIAVLTSLSLAQDVVDLTAVDLADPPRELEGAQVRVEGGRIFAATPRAAVLKVENVYLPLSFDENALPWQNCRGLEPVSECRLPVTGTLAIDDTARPGLHDVTVEQ